METIINKNTVGITAEQLAGGTPNDKKFTLKSFYKDDKCTISPAKDHNGRYMGIQENIPEMEKLKMGYVPTIESKMKLTDGMEIDTNLEHWAKDWVWMKHCREIASDYAQGQATPGAYFYIHRPGFESAKKVDAAAQKNKLENYIFNDSNENLYNRVSILGVDMSREVISEVKEYLLDMVKTDPGKVAQVYENATFSLELLYMHAIKKEIINLRNGVYLFGEILLGVDKKAVISFFANPKNTGTTRAIEAVTYGTKQISKSPLANEAVGDSSEDDMDSPSAEKEEPVFEAIGNGSLEVFVDEPTNVLDDVANPSKGTAEAAAINKKKGGPKK